MDDLDRIDRSLLRLLQEDGRRTTLDLARRVGLSPTGASQRIKRLFSEGFIRAVRAVLDPARIGKAQLVFIEVRLDHTAPHGRGFHEVRRWICAQRWRVPGNRQDRGHRHNP